MLLVANLVYTKWWEKRRKMTKTLAHGYSSESTQWKLSNEYYNDRVLKKFCVLVPLTKVASASKGLIIMEVNRCTLWSKQHNLNAKYSAKSYPMNTNMTGFGWFTKSFASFASNESSLSIGRVNFRQLLEKKMRTESTDKNAVMLEYGSKEFMNMKKEKNQ